VCGLSFLLCGVNIQYAMRDNYIERSCCCHPGDAFDIRILRVLRSYKPWLVRIFWIVEFSIGFGTVPLVDI